jgi:hypothetical protein
MKLSAKTAIHSHTDETATSPPSSSEHSAMSEEVDLEAGNMHGKEESIGIIRYDVPRTFAEIEVCLIGLFVEVERAS